MSLRISQWVKLENLKKQKEAGTIADSEDAQTNERTGIPSEASEVEQRVISIWMDVLGADEIRLVGVDLNTYYSFYQYDDRWGIDNYLKEYIKNRKIHQDTTMLSFKKSVGIDEDKIDFHKTAQPVKKDTSWALWQVSGSSDFRLEGLKYYNHLA